MTQGLHDEEVLGKVYDTTLVRRLWPFLRPHSGLLVLGLVLFPPLILFELLPARLFALGLDHLVGTAERSEWAWLAWLAQPPEGLPLLVWLAVLMLGVTVLGGALNLARMVAMAVMGQRAMRDLRRVLFDHVQRLPLRFFDRYPVGRLVTRLTNDIETLSEMFTSGVVQVITDLLKLAVIALVLFQLDTWLALAAMALVPLLTVAALIFRWKVRTAFRIVRVKIARINAHIQETISGMKVVQLFVREKRNLEDFSEINAEHRNAWFRSIRYDALLFSTVEFASNLTIALILWYGAGLIWAGVIELSVLFIFVDYMKRFVEPLRDLAAKFSVMQSSMASLERVFELLDTPPESSRRPAHLTAPFRGEIEFESVCFAYGEQPVLEDVSFRVAPGERIALVGPTGSGKTTLLKLLIGLYEPQSGSIRIDGVDVRDLPREELRRHIAFVLQDVYLFSGDLAYNVSLGRDDISVEDVERASRIVHADRLIQ